MRLKYGKLWRISEDDFGPVMVYVPLEPWLKRRRRLLVMILAGFAVGWLCADLGLVL